MTARPSGLPHVFRVWVEIPPDILGEVEKRLHYHPVKDFSIIREKQEEPGEEGKHFLEFLLIIRLTFEEARDSEIVRKRIFGKESERGGIWSEIPKNLRHAGGMIVSAHIRGKLEGKLLSVKYKFEEMLPPTARLPYPDN